MNILINNGSVLLADGSIQKTNIAIKDNKILAISLF